MFRVRGFILRKTVVYTDMVRYVLGRRVCLISIEHTLLPTHLLPTHSSTNTFFYQHILLPIHSSTNTFFYQHILLRTHSSTNTFFYQHILLPTHSSTNTFFYQHILLPTHSSTNTLFYQQDCLHKCMYCTTYRTITVYTNVFLKMDPRDRNMLKTLKLKIKILI